MYAFGPFVDEAISGRCRDYVAVGQDGHGVNSYAMHYFLVYGPVMLFVQIPWGGVYMDEHDQARIVRRRFAEYADLIGAIERLPRNYDPRDRRLLVLDVDFSRIYESGWVTVNAEAAIDWREIPRGSFPAQRRSPIKRAIKQLEASTALPEFWWHDNPAERYWLEATDRFKPGSCSSRG